MSKMTLDKLARMIQKGFLDIDKKFLDVDSKFLGIDDKFLSIENRLATIDAKLIDVDHKLAGMAQQKDLLALTERVDRLEKRVEYGFGMVAQEFKDIQSQLKKVDIRDANILDLQLRMDEVEKKLETP